MRAMEEYKAEIFRRSEEKIIQRKKTRRRIAALCVPLCLCVGITLLAAGLGGQEKGDMMNMAQSPEAAVQLNGLDHTAESPLPMEDEEAPSLTIRKQITVDPQLHPEEAAALESLLSQLSYSPHKVCKCLPQYELQMPHGTYGVHLSQGYARCEEGQADLTEAQIQELKRLIDVFSADE